MLRALECDFATTKLSWFIFATKIPLCLMTLWSRPFPEFSPTHEKPSFFTVAPIAVAAFSKHLARLALPSSLSPLTLRRPM